MTKNEMTLIGFLGSDPELKYTPSGRPVTNFSVATTERWKDKAGAAQERTEWHRIVAWGSLAEVVAKHLQKGRHVYIAGPLRSREYEKDGVTRRVWEVIANEVLFLDRAEKQTAEDRPAAGTEEDNPF
ncbi:MAG TPA: single-stranded DNA-binding protein [Polyangia bacterium]|jgi:single-strand DNA-binding protein|nr:single-stranded DNA-binding protein [Polyangia bacterium]